MRNRFNSAENVANVSGITPSSWHSLSRQPEWRLNNKPKLDRLDHIKPPLRIISKHHMPPCHNTSHGIGKYKNETAAPCQSRISHGKLLMKNDIIRVVLPGSARLPHQNRTPAYVSDLYVLYRSIVNDDWSNRLTFFGHCWHDIIK
jgi:hypothetical protein